MRLQEAMCKLYECLHIHISSVFHSNVGFVASSRSLVFVSTKHCKRLLGQKQKGDLKFWTLQELVIAFH